MGFFPESLHFPKSDQIELISSVLQRAVKQTREENTDGVRGTDQRHADSLKAEAFLSGKNTDALSHAKQLHRTAEAGQHAGDGNRRNDRTVRVDAAVLGGAAVEADRLELIAERRFLDDDIDHRHCDYGEKNAPV